MAGAWKTCESSFGKEWMSRSVQQIVVLKLVKEWPWLSGRNPCEPRGLEPVPKDLARSR